MKVELAKLRQIILGDPTLERSKTFPAKTLFQLMYTEEGVANTQAYFLHKSMGEPRTLFFRTRFFHAILPSLQFTAL